MRYQYYVLHYIMLFADAEKYAILYIYYLPASREFTELLYRRISE